MKPGDMVTLKSDRVAVQFMSEELEDHMNSEISNENAYHGSMGDITSFRRGSTAVVLEVCPTNSARVKLFYSSGKWWGNVSDLVVMV